MHAPHRARLSLIVIATVLTMIVVPVLYAIFFRAQPRTTGA